MASVPMIASARQTYAGRALKTGDAFDASSEAEAADLIAVNMARRAKPAPAMLATKPVVASPATYETKTVTAAPTTADDPSEEDPPGDEPEGVELTTTAPSNKHSHYNRRDMRAKR